MNEKRFRVFKFPDTDKYGISDDIAEVTVALCDNKGEAGYLCDLLNKLNNENEHLKSTCKDRYYDIKDLQAECIKLDKENEELKENCKNYNWYKQCKTLLNEDEQLRKRVMILQDKLKGLMK